MHFYIPGAIAGVIILQVSIIAPTMFKKLKIEDFGVAIRAIWPKFFVMLAILAALSMSLMFFSKDGNNYHFGLSGFTLVAALVLILGRLLISLATGAAADVSSRASKELARFSASFF